MIESIYVKAFKKEMNKDKVKGESWFQSFVISSSPTFIPSLSLPHLPHFFFYLQNRTCTETPLQVEVHEIIFPTRHHTHETGSEQESCAYFTPAMQSVQS
jgi:hypothetical protein